MNYQEGMIKVFEVLYFHIQEGYKKKTGKILFVKRVFISDNRKFSLQLVISMLKNCLQEKHNPLEAIKNVCCFPSFCNNFQKYRILQNFVFELCKFKIYFTNIRKKHIFSRENIKYD